MSDRITPYGAFNYSVTINSDPPIEGGFSDVSGIGTEVTVAEYRNGNEKTKYVRKIPGIHKVSDVTLKRGIINSKNLWDWIKKTRDDAQAAQLPSVKIALNDEKGAPVQSWVLKGVIPMKYTGPTLAGKGGGDVAMEELVLSAEELEIEVP